MKTCISCNQINNKLTKLCSKCYYIKNRDSILQKSRENRSKPESKLIRARKHKEWASKPENRKRRNEKALVYRSNPEVKLRQKNNTKKLKSKYVRAKYKSSIRNFEFNISFDYYENLLNKGCHYCHSKLIDVVAGSSLDRIDNAKGYTEDNVLPCCDDCNRIRGIFLTVPEMEVAMKAVLELRKSLASIENSSYTDNNEGVQNEQPNIQTTQEYKV